MIHLTEAMSTSNCGWIWMLSRNGPKAFRCFDACNCTQISFCESMIPLASHDAHQTHHPCLPRSRKATLTKSVVNQVTAATATAKHLVSMLSWCVAAYSYSCMDNCEFCKISISIHFHVLFFNIDISDMNMISDYLHTQLQAMKQCW